MLTSIFVWLLAHLDDIPGLIELGRKLKEDFSETDPVTIEILDAEWAKLRPVPPKSDGSI